MADRNRGMGRGLAAILASTTTGEVRPELRNLAIETVVPNPNQPRRQFDDEALKALADSIRERGVLQPILVRPQPGGTYELIAGERRWRAAQLAELDTIPAVVRSDSDSDSLELALIENMARLDLNPVEEARACSMLVEELGLTREEVGRRVGRSRVAVSNLLRLLDLPDAVLDLIAAGGLTEGHGRALLLVDDHDERRRLGRAAVEGGWSVRATEDRARDASSSDPSGSPRVTKRIKTPHPDQLAAADDIKAVFQSAFGLDVSVRPDGRGYRVSFVVESEESARDLLAPQSAEATA